MKFQSFGASCVIPSCQQQESILVAWVASVCGLREWEACSFMGSLLQLLPDSAGQVEQLSRLSCESSWMTVTIAWWIAVQKVPHSKTLESRTEKQKVNMPHGTLQAEC